MLSYIYDIRFNTMAYSKSNKFDSKKIALAKLNKALGHPARIAILEIIANKKTCICGQIVDVIPLAQSTISQHLKELKECGLIKGVIEGPKTCYCLDQKNIEEFERLLGSLFKNLKKNKFKKC